MNTLANQQRVLRLEGAYNVRDLGGYETKDGSMTRWGLLYRADNLHALSEGSRQELVKRGIATVIDLRYSSELALQRDVFSDSRDAAYHNVSLVLASQGDYVRGLGEQYIDLLEGAKEPIRRVFELLAGSTENGSALFHCKVGKDRTGIIAALLLELAGVPHATIAEDYALTAGCLAPLMDELRQDRPPAVSPEAYEVHLGSPPENMIVLLNHLKSAYGDAEGYLRSSGIEPEQIQALKQRMLAD
ncbi:protein-tyrosine phosphatase [Paenibacillus sp. UNC496MF]|nr:protein-tyrosine phosphatase [Paenibacillus sp. UNC496MF]